MVRSDVFSPQNQILCCYKMVRPESDLLVYIAFIINKEKKAFFLEIYISVQLIHLLFEAWHCWNIFDDVLYEYIQSFLLIHFIYW